MARSTTGDFPHRHVKRLGLEHSGTNCDLWEAALWLLFLAKGKAEPFLTCPDTDVPCCDPTDFQDFPGIVLYSNISLFIPIETSQMGHHYNGFNTQGLLPFALIQTSDDMGENRDCGITAFPPHISSCPVFSSQEWEMVPLSCSLLWKQEPHFLQLPFLSFLKKILFIWVQCPVVFRHMRRGHQIPLQMRHYVVAGNWT